MKMIRAVVRPEREWDVSSALAKNGFRALTKWDVLGRGNQQGIQVGSQMYDDLAKSMMLIVVEDQQVKAAVETIREAGYTGFPRRRQGLCDAGRRGVHGPHGEGGAVRLRGGASRAPAPPRAPLALRLVTGGPVCYHRAVPIPR